jgi:hypothetical protein
VARGVAAPSVLSPEIRGILLRSKWAAGKAVRAGLAEEGAYLNRYVTDEQRSRRPIFIATLRGQLAVFPRYSLDPYDKNMGASPPVRLGPP